MKFIYISFLLMVATLLTCGTASKRDDEPEKKIVIAQPEEPEDKYSVTNYESENPGLYEKYLVSLSDYTTEGKYYHEKHQVYLLGLAEVLTEKYSYLLKERSIGFYYDRLGKEKDKLYLGLDITCSQDVIPAKADYFATGRVMMSEYVTTVLNVARRYEDILSESDVEGVVVGLFWFRRGRREFVTVWLLKQNVREFYNDRLTFKELIIKSTVTDSDGKKIRLTL